MVTEVDVYVCVSVCVCVCALRAKTQNLWNSVTQNRMKTFEQKTRI